MVPINHSIPNYDTPTDGDVEISGTKYLYWYNLGSSYLGNHIYGNFASLSAL